MTLDPLTAALDIGTQLIGHFFPNQADADAAKLKLLELQQNGELTRITGQLDINKVEASNVSIFVSGWRPFCGWIGGLGLFYSAIGEPSLRFISTVFLKYTGTYPVLDTTITLQVLLGMLGIAGMRTFEKVKNVASK